VAVFSLFEKRQGRRRNLDGGRIFRHRSSYPIYPMELPPQTAPLEFFSSVPSAATQSLLGWQQKQAATQWCSISKEFRADELVNCIVTAYIFASGE